MVSSDDHVVHGEDGLSVHPQPGYLVPLERVQAYNCDLTGSVTGPNVLMPWIRISLFSLELVVLRGNVKEDLNDR